MGLQQRAADRFTMQSVGFIFLLNSAGNFIRKMQSKFDKFFVAAVA
jgi:hypothetical protein